MSQYRSQLFGGAFAALIAVSPLFIYWKVYAGSFFWDSYQNPGEGLDIFYPHIHNFLFSFRKGWLLYSPLIALALLGFIPLWRRHRRSPLRCCGSSVSNSTWFPLGRLDGTQAPSGSGV
ncbi:MAG: hypothetical protein IPG74_14450 [Flavobacteriales bacterium]|nr:hypothetical protein [Flavobacteriales bacterium]